MIVDRDFVGNAFHNMMNDMAEDYTLTMNNGEEYTGKISLVAKTASTYMLAEREYLMNGTMTFPSMAEQTTFRGCYFHREINPERIYLLASTIPKDTTPYVADIYAVECNARVSLAYMTETKDKLGNRVLKPIIFQEDLPAYWYSSLQKMRESSDGNYIETRYFVQLPARYGLAVDEVVIRKQSEYNFKTGETGIKEVKYRVESINNSLSFIDEDNNVYGIYDAQLSLDTRG